MVPIFQNIRVSHVLNHVAALKYHDYRNTWIAGMLSSSGMWSFMVVNIWLALRISDSSIWVGIVTFSAMIPYLVVSPFGGLIADRFNRRDIILITLVASSINSAILAGFVLVGMIELWHIAVFAFSSGVLLAIEEPAIQSLIPNQIRKEDLLNAITLNSATRHGSRFFGLLVAAPLLAVGFIDVGGVLILSSVFYGIGAMQMRRVHTVSTGKMGSGQNFLESTLAGLAYVYSNVSIGLIIFLVAFHCALVMSFESILPIFSRQQLGAVDGSTLAYLIMAFGLGALVAALAIAGIRSDLMQGRIFMFMGVFSGVTPIFLAFSEVLPVAFLSCVAMGVSQAGFMALANTYVQRLAPDHLRGRISGIYILHAGGIMAFSNLGYGFAAEFFSARLILSVTGVLFIVVLIAMSMWQPFLRRICNAGRIVVA